MSISQQIKAAKTKEEFKVAVDMATKAANEFASKKTVRKHRQLILNKSL